MNPYAKLTFYTSGGGDFTLTVPDVDIDKLEASVAIAMNGLIASKAIDTKSGSLSSNKSALYYTVKETTFTVK